MPTVTRPIWRGQLRLSLVSIAVELFTATKASARPSFHQIHAPTGKRIHYEKVVDGLGKVPSAEIKKGYEVDKGDYVLLEDEELDAVRLETRKTLELVQFVDEAEIPPLYFDSPYFVAPADDLAEDAFRVIRDALRQTKKVGLGQLALRGKEYLVAVKPCGKGLLLETLHYADEIRPADPFFSDVSKEAAPDDLLDVATALIAKKSAPFDPKAFKDHYQAALRDLIERKLKAKGARVSTPEEKPARTGSNVVDLMAALKRSLETTAPPAKDVAPKRKPSRAAAKSDRKPERKKAG